MSVSKLLLQSIIAWLPSTRSRGLKCCPWGSLGLSCLCGWWNVEDRMAQTYPKLAGQYGLRPSRHGVQPHILIMQPAFLNSHSIFTNIKTLLSRGIKSSNYRISVSALLCMEHATSQRHFSLTAVIYFYIDFQTEGIRKVFYKSIFLQKDMFKSLVIVQQ